VHDLHTTIVAVATPSGRGGLGCLRISGKAAFEISASFFRPATAIKPRAGGQPRFGQFLGRDGQAVDHGFLVYFKAGSAFTGETTAEIWAHGNPAILEELVACAIAKGALPAGPGEFTYRALCNGRLDLARAEAVRDLIAARTLYQARVAMAQAEGSLSRRLAPLCEKLAEWIARGEAAVEFVDEADVHLPERSLNGAIDEAIAECATLLESFAHGRVVREGAALAIVGRPNAGKSTLFNRLLATNRAIVHDTAGTTRDVLEDELNLDGIPVRLFDTAGLGEPQDTIEQEGIRRTELARVDADLVLLVLDGTADDCAQQWQQLIESRSDDELARTAVVINKCDIDLVATRPLPCPDALRVSALTGKGLNELRAALAGRLRCGGPIEDPILTNSRHALAIEQALTALRSAAEAAAQGLSEELVLEDMREALRVLGVITGEVSVDDLFEIIFSTFCIGK
jgi:tRNA modification GTPase